MEYGWMLLRMVVVLGAVCALAYVTLRWGVRRFVNLQPPGARRLEVVERMGVAPRRSVMVLRVGREFWLVGSSEAGVHALGRLEAADWEAEMEEGGKADRGLQQGRDGEKSELAL